MEEPHSGRGSLFLSISRGLSPPGIVSSQRLDPWVSEPTLCLPRHQDRFRNHDRRVYLKSTSAGRGFDGCRAALTVSNPSNIYPVLGATDSPLPTSDAVLTPPLSSTLFVSRGQSSATLPRNSSRLLVAHRGEATISP